MCSLLACKINLIVPFGQQLFVKFPFKLYTQEGIFEVLFCLHTGLELKG